MENGTPVEVVPNWRERVAIQTNKRCDRGKRWEILRSHYLRNRFLLGGGVPREGHGFASGNWKNESAHSRGGGKKRIAFRKTLRRTL